MHSWRFDLQAIQGAETCRLLRQGLCRKFQPEIHERYAPPRDFEDAIHIFLAAESESPVVVLDIDATTQGGRISFHMDVQDVIDNVKEAPEAYLCVITDDADEEPPEGCRAVSRVEIDEWMARVAASGEKFSLVLSQE